MRRPLKLSAFSTLLLIVAILGCPSSSSAQEVVSMNQYVGVSVQPSTGKFTIKTVKNGKLDLSLTFHDFSYLSLNIGGQYYTNNTVPQPIYVSEPIGSAKVPKTPDVNMDNGVTKLIADTVETVWDEGDFKIVQDVYPVKFRASGQIVLKVSVLNTSSTPVDVRSAQWLNDVQSNINDDPWILDRWEYPGQTWRYYKSSAPSFYMGFEKNPSGLNLGTVGTGFTNDTFPPDPMGLTPCSAMVIGDDDYLAKFTYGTDQANGSGTTIVKDNAVLMQWKGSSVQSGTPANPTLKQIFRTSYGTNEFCVCYGNVIAINIFPTHLIYNQTSRTYTPNPFQVLSMMINTGSASVSNASVTQTVSAPLQIVSPGSGLKSTIGNTTIPPGGVKDYLWTDQTTPNTNCSGKGSYASISFDLNGSGIPPGNAFPVGCSAPGSTTDGCDILVDCADVDTVAPRAISPQHTNTSGVFIDSSFDVVDNDPKDFGIESIYPIWNPANVASNFPVTIPAIKDCPRGPITVHVQQKDSTIGGSVLFLLKDCAGNSRLDTVIFPAHPRPGPTPDTFAPKFYNTSYSHQNSPLHIDTGCTTNSNYQTSDWVVYDTENHKYGHGLKSLTPLVSDNMKFSSLPFGAAADFARFTLAVIDTMKNGSICVEAVDTAGNKATLCINYCTVPDTNKPDINAAINSYHFRDVALSDNRAWDRGIDHVYVQNYINVTATPALDNPNLGCRDTFLLKVSAVDSNKLSYFEVVAVDCYGNKSIYISRFGSDTDLNCPKYTSTPINADSIHISIVDSADRYEQGIQRVWFTGVKNMKLIRLNPSGAVEAHCPGDLTSTFNDINGTPTGVSRPLFRQRIEFDLAICDTNNIDVNQACVTVHAVDGAGHEICSGIYEWCVPLTNDTLSPLVSDANPTCSSVDFIATDNRQNDRGLSRMTLSNTMNMHPFDVTLSSSELSTKTLTGSVITKGKSATGTVTVIDAFGAKQNDPAVRAAHTATGNFWLYAQDLIMKAGHVFLDEGTYKVSVVLDKSDSIQQLSKKNLWQLQFSFHLTGDPNIQFVTAQPGSFAPNWNVTVTPNGTGYTVTATGAPLPDWTTKDDEILSLVFHANRTDNTGATQIVIDPIACGADSYAVSYNGGVDTGATFNNASFAMHAPFGNVNGGILTIKGFCSPFISENGNPPTTISLAPIKPNPAWKGTPALHLLYTIAEEGAVRLDLFNALGERVRSIVSETQKQGEYQLDISSSELPEGMYFLRLEAGGKTLSRRVILGGE